MSDQRPKIACLPSGPYYLINDPTPRAVAHLQDAQGNPVRQSRASRCAVAVVRATSRSATVRTAATDSRTRNMTTGSMTHEWAMPARGSPSSKTAASARMPASAQTVCGGRHRVTGQTFGEGASPDRYTLCRCGASKNNPICDGSHWHVGFKDGD